METLASWIARDGALNELDAVGWIIRLAKGLEPIHALGVAHGSITAEAVRIEGSSRASRGFLVDARRLHDLVAYHSPERADGEEISPANDTWAVAVTLYLALTGSLPFPGANDQDVKRRILGPPASPLAVFDVGDDGLQRVLDRAFSRDSARRLTKLRDLRQALEAWHTDPDVSQLPPLDDEGDKEDSSSAFRALLEARARSDDDGDESATISVPLKPAAAAGVAVLHEDDESATEVRNLSTFQEHLAAYKAQSQPPPPLRSTDRPGRSPTNNPALAASSARPRDEAPAVPRLLGRAEPSMGPRQPPLMMKGGTIPIPNFPLVPPPLDPPAPDGQPGRAEPAAGAQRPFHDEDSEDEPATAIMEPLPASSPLPGARGPAMSPGATAPLQPSPLRTRTPHGQAPAPGGDSFTAPATWSGAQLAPLPVPGAQANPPDLPATTAGGDPSPSDAPDALATRPSSLIAEGRLSIGLAPGQPAPAPSNSLLVPLLAGFGLLIAGGAAAFFLFRRPATDLTTPSATPSTVLVASASSAPTSVTPSASPLVATATGSPSGTSTASPSGTSTASPSGTSTASPSGTSTASPSGITTGSPTAATTTSPSAPTSPSDVNACMTPLFPSDTFIEIPPSLGFVCTITDPRKGGRDVRTEVVRAGNRKRVSDGMREWAVLGWYEMAAFAVLRSSCCPSAAPIDLPITIPTCDIETALKELATIAASPAADDAKVTAALEAYTKEVRCVGRAGGADSFGQKGGPQGGESSTFEKTLKRVRAAAKKK